MVHIFVALEKDERGYPPFHTEEIDACIVSPDVVRIEGIPVFVRGMARGDLVKVKRVAGQSGEVQLWATGTEFASAHWTTRVLPVVTASLVAVVFLPPHQQTMSLRCSSMEVAWGNGISISALVRPMARCPSSRLDRVQTGNHPSPIDQLFDDDQFFGPRGWGNTHDDSGTSASSAAGSVSSEVTCCCTSAENASRSSLRASAQASNTGFVAAVSV